MCTCERQLCLIQSVTNCSPLLILYIYNVQVSVLYYKLYINTIDSIQYLSLSLSLSVSLLYSIFRSSLYLFNNIGRAKRWVRERVGKVWEIKFSSKLSWRISSIPPTCYMVIKMTIHIISHNSLSHLIKSYD